MNRIDAQRDHRDPRLLGELGLRHRGEVEADEGDDRPGDDRRQEELDSAVADPVDDQADEEQGDAAQRIPPSAAGMPPWALAARPAR